MKLRRPPPRRDAEAGLVPLINVVFLLLVFFMLAGTLSPPEPLAVTPPRSAGGRGAEAGGLAVLVDARGWLAVEGQRVDPAGLAALAARRLAAEPDLAVTVKADAALEARQLLTVLDALRSAGAVRVSLLTAGGR